MSQVDYIYGIHAVAAMLAERPEQIRELVIFASRKDQRIGQLIEQAGSEGIRIKRLEKNAFDRLRQQWLVPEQGHQGVMAARVALKLYRESDWQDLLEQAKAQNKPAFILILDGVTDPHNLGACLRSAEAAGVQMVIAPKDHSAPLTPVAIKVACGAADTVPYIQVTNLARVLKQLKEAGVWLYGAAGEAKADLYQTTLTGPLALILGAEGEGMRRLTREHCDALVKIPMQGKVSSLNVSVACGVMLFEALRQRLG